VIKFHQVIKCKWRHTP